MGPITHYFPSCLRIHGKHTETLTCHVMPLGHFKLILGFPWLARHNPTIDWQSGQLTFSSPFCASTCLFPPPSPPPPPIPTPSATPSLPAVLAGISPSSPSSPPPHPDLFHQVPKVYHDYLDVFSESQANVLPPHRKYDLDITLLPDSAPPWGPIYSMSAPENIEMKRYLKAYLANGFIRPSKSPAAAPVMFVKRPDGKLRLVVDYRGLNKVTVKNRFPLPLIPEMLDRLHLAKVFTKIDLRNAYHQVRVKA